MSKSITFQQTTYVGGSKTDSGSKATKLLWSKTHEDTFRNNLRIWTSEETNDK